MKNYRSKLNISQAFKLNHIVPALIAMLLVAGINVFGWELSTANPGGSNQPSTARNVLNGEYTRDANGLFLVTASRPAGRSHGNVDLFNPAVSLAAANGIFFDTIADLAISKSDSIDTINAGATTIYVIRIKNNGTAPVVGATLKDAVASAGLTLNSVSCSAIVGNKCTVSPTLATLTGPGVALPTLQPGDIYNLDVSATVSANPPTSVTNTASVTLADQQGSNGAFDTNIVNRVDWTISKTDGSLTYTPGAPISYSIVVRNLGPADATGGAITDTVPAFITGVTTSCVPTAAASCGTNGSVGNNVSFTNVAIAAGVGNFLTITVNGTVSPSATGLLTNNVHVEPGPQLDTDLTNNDASDTDDIVRLIDLAVTKTDGITTYNPGSPNTYTIKVTNNGPSNATGATITDAVPATITGVTVNCAATGSATCGTNGSAGNNISFTNVDIAAGAANFLTLTVSGTISPSTSGNLVNTVTVTPGSGQTDTNLSNNTATDTDTANPIDLAVTKTDGITVYTPGNPIAYTIVVSNNGPANAVNASISDPVPATITGVSVGCAATGTASCGTNGSAGNNISFTGVNINAGAGNFLTLTVSGTVSPATTGLLTNTVTVTPSALQVDSNPANNTATDTDDSPGTPVLIICKQVGPADQIAVGTVFNFTSPQFPGTISVAAGANGSPNCSSPITLSASGNATVTEAAQTDVAVTDITASPAGRFVSKDLPNRVGVVSVPNSLTPTTITFTNHGTGTPTGVVEICKQIAANDVMPVGTLFSFTITGMVNPAPIVVPAGPFGAPRCSSPITVAAGNQTITEAVVANTSVQGIAVNPANRLVSSSLPNRTVTINVVQGDVTNQTVVTYTNQTTRTGVIEICKDAADTDVTGPFTFTVEGAPGQIFTVQAGFCSNPITVTIPQIGTTPFTARVTELARPNYRLVDVSTFPTNALAGPFTPDAGYDANGVALANNTNGGYAVVNLAVGGAETMKIVRFRNQSLPGLIKVCKITADPTNIPVGTIFDFTVTGSGPTSATDLTPIPVSEVVRVQAGPVAQNGFCQFATNRFIVGTTVTVTETAVAPLPFGLTFADVRVSRIRGLPGLASSSLVNKTATLTARNTTAEVEFTNFIFRPAVLKVCKTGGPGVTGNFSFTMSLPDPLVSYAVSTTPIVVPVGSCTFAQGPFPAIPAFPGIGTFNFNTRLTLTEAASGTTVVAAVTSPTGGTITQDLAGRAGTITLNQQANAPLLPLNEITFLNNATPQPPTSSIRFDFDGDGTSDKVIYRNGTWWYAASGSNDAQTPIQFGIAGDKLVAADYDGDGKTDAAVYRNGTWYVFGTTAGLIQLSFGLPTDIPQPGDFDGDGKADFVVYRPSDGNWYMQLSNDGFKAIHFGINTDRPVAADFDGDGKMDQAVYRDGTWYILGSTAGFYGVQFGIAGDIPVQADYDGDLKADMAVYRGGVWYILGSTSGFKAVNFGLASDTPVPADYDGDGKTDVAVYRTSSNTWFMLKSSQSLNPNGGLATYTFGSPGDVLMNY